MSNYSDQVLATPGLVAYWQCNEAAGALADSSGHGHVATPNTGVFTYAQAGARGSLGNAIDWPAGIGAYFTVPDHADWDAMRAAGSVECWLRQDAAGYCEVVGRAAGGGAASYEWELWIDTGVNSAKYLERSQMPSGYAQVGWPSAGDAAWHHYVLMWDATSLRKYADGALAATTPAPGAGYRDLPGPLWIGSQDSGFAAIHRAQHFALYTRALTAAEVLAHYNEVPVGHSIPPRYW